MIYKTGGKVWELCDDRVKEHTIEDIKFLTWIQLLKIEGKWQPADIFFANRAQAMEADERNTFRMYK